MIRRGAGLASDGLAEIATVALLGVRGTQTATRSPTACAVPSLSPLSSSARPSSAYYVTTGPRKAGRTPSRPPTSTRSSATQVRSGPTTSSTRDSARGTSTKRRYFWFGGLLALVSDLLSWLACFSALVSRKHCISDSRISQRGIKIKSTVNSKKMAPGLRPKVCGLFLCADRRRRRRRSLLRIIHARGAIPNEMGPTRCRATPALNQSADAGLQVPAVDLSLPFAPSWTWCPGGQTVSLAGGGGGGGVYLESYTREAEESNLINLKR